MSKTSGTNGKATKTMTSFRLPSDILARLQAVSYLSGKSQADLMAEGLEIVLTRVARERKIERLVSDTVKARKK